MRRKLLPFLFALLLFSTMLIATSHAAPFAYMANYETGANSVSVVDLATNTVTATIAVGGNPLAVSTNPAGTRVYVTNTADNTVSVIDTASITEITKISGFTGLAYGGIAISPNGKKGYALNYNNNTVSVIDTATNEISNTITTGFANPNGVTFSPDGSKAYVSNHTAHTISVIDVATDSVTDTISVDNYPRGLVTNPAGTRLYVICGMGEENSIVAINTSTNQTVPAERISIGIGGSSWGIAINPAGTKLYASRQTSNDLKVVDIATHAVEATVTGLSRPYGVSVTPDGKSVVVATHWGNAVSIIDSTTLATTTVNGLYAPWSFGNFIASPPAVTDGLVSLWRGEGNAFDVIGGNHGTPQGGATFAAGKVWQAFSFAGTAYVQAPESVADFGSDPFTVGFWMYAASDPPSDAYLVGRSHPNGGQGWDIRFDDNSIKVCGVNGWGFNIVSTASVALNSWHYIAVASTGSQVTLYIDGVVKGTSPRSAISSAPNPFRIGFTSNYGGSGFNGLIDDVAIYNRALSSKEVLGLVDPNRPVSWWKGENNALDSVGGNHGTLQGVNFAAGKIGQAFSLDGADDYVTVPASSTWAFGTGDFTIDFWAYSATNDDHRPLINNRKTPASNNMWAIEIYGTANIVEFHSGLTEFLVATNPLTNSSWNHIAVTRSGSTLSMYINGVLSGSVSNSTDFSEINDLQIGRDIMQGNQLGGRSFQGLIDDVRIYNRSLSASEVTMLANIPDAFSFVSQTGMPQSTLIVSNPITVAGLGNAAPISITACTSPPCEYKINGGSWTSLLGEVNNGDTVMVRQTSSGSYSATTTATLTIGGVNGDFSVTTAAVNDPNASGLVSWWKAENNTFDSVGGNHGALQGGAGFACGTSCGGFYFNGINGYFSVPDPRNIPVGNSQRTISARIMSSGPTSGTKYQTVLGYGTPWSNGQTFLLEWGGEANDRKLYLTGWNSDLAGSTTLNYNQQYHVAATYDGTTVRLYVNDVLEASADRTLNTAINASGLMIGNSPPNDGWHANFYGIIDRVKIFNRTLSATEISSLAGTLPDPFAFPPVFNAARSAFVESEAITVTGATSPSTISVSNGDEYRINGGAWKSSSDKINSGNLVRVRLTSSDKYSDTKTATLTIGGVEGIFSVTTLADIEKPVVTTFSLHTTVSSAMSVAVDTFTATDNDSVSGYLVTDTATPPAADDPGWSATAPATVNLTTAGDNILRAWAKDPAGNVSVPLTATVLLKPVRREPENDYVSLQTAYGEAGGDETIRVLAVTLTENIDLNQPRNISISGGYEDGYAGQSGYSTISGSLTVGKGTLTVERVVIK